MKIKAIILFATLLYGTAEALFLSHESEVKQENDSLNLMCSDKVRGELGVWWGPKNKKLGTKTNPQTRTTTYGIQLMFHKIKKEHAGKYTCKTSSEEAVFTLFVESPMIFADTPNEQEGEEGQNITVKCEAKGGYITWLLDNGEPPKGPKYEILGDGILIKNATKEDSRTYICQAVNEMSGTSKEKPIRVTIKHKPRLPQNTTERHYMKEEIVYGIIDEIVNLTCEVEAEPPPSFRWYDRSNRKRIGEEISESPYKSVLMLKMTPSNIGEYRCRAHNKYGDLDIIFKLYNGTRPNPPTMLNLKQAHSDSLDIEIDGPEPTEAEIKSHMTPIGYRLEYKLAEDNESEWMASSFALTEDKTYSLTELVHSTEYEVRAATENRAGLSEYTNSTIFKTEPNSANSFSLNLSVLTSTILVLVVLNGFPKHHI